MYVPVLEKPPPSQEPDNINRDLRTLHPLLVLYFSYPKWQYYNTAKQTNFPNKFHISTDPERQLGQNKHNTSVVNWYTDS